MLPGITKPEIYLLLIVCDYDDLKQAKSPSKDIYYRFLLNLFLVLSSKFPLIMLQYPHLEQALKYYFGYDNFRPGQRQIIEDALSKR
ncbi:MAG: hypothetical protein VKL59_26425, partial [Nostocaceae cyanobacterium]|nr:hypothetical protein [Nostocaceae cyanobacterium]